MVEKRQVELREGQEAYGRFKTFVHAVVAVPKKEIIREQRKYEARKKGRVVSKGRKRTNK